MPIRKTDLIRQSRASELRERSGRDQKLSGLIISRDFGPISWLAAIGTSISVYLVIVFSVDADVMWLFTQFP